LALCPPAFGINAFANALLRLLKVDPQDEVTSAVTGGNGAVVGFITTEDVLEELVGAAATPGA
jgi:CBS domain containing-hemolysin-like protein